MSGRTSEPIFPVDCFMADFRLNDAGEIELVTFGEETQGRVWDICYPELDELLASPELYDQSGELTSEGRERVRKAVDHESKRLWDSQPQDESSTELGKEIAERMGTSWVPVSGSSGLPSPSNEVPNGSNWYLSNNRINGWGYDLAGNITSIQNMPRTYAYDAENRQTTATVNSVATTYAYDGEGRRVSKNWNGQTTTFVYDAFGNLAAEYGGPSGPTGTQYLTTDHLGSTRLVTDSSGAAVKCYDYLPFGEEIGNGTAARTTPCFGSGSYPAAGGATNTEFTSKERDAETGLDFFRARYMSSAQGRFTSPDQPLVDQHPEDPQSWNMYAYVRNNPLAHVDPDGKACAALLGNTGSGFCQRADTYANFDNMVHDRTRFFAAASAATQELADVAVPGLGRAGTSAETRAFLEGTGQALLKVNTEAVGQIMSGQMSGSGPELDAKMVHLEQTAVQKGLDAFKSTNAGAYGAAINQINGLLNGKSSMTANALGSLGGLVLPTDRAYAQVLGGVRKGLGHDINFANQKDREAIGNALVRHIRETGGCDVAGDKANGCGH
jgi:RHS repeat-associated protein